MIYPPSDLLYLGLWNCYIVYFCKCIYRRQLTISLSYLILLSSNNSLIVCEPRFSILQTQRVIWKCDRRFWKYASLFKGTLQIRIVHFIAYQGHWYWSHTLAHHSIPSHFCCHRHRYLHTCSATNVIPMMNYSAAISQQSVASTVSVSRIKFITVTPLWARWRLKSPPSQLFTQPFIRAQIKENVKVSRHWPLCGEFTDDRWIPRTNVQ